MAAANLTAKEVARVLLLRVVTGDLVLRASRYLGASRASRLPRLH